MTMTFAPFRGLRCQIHYIVSPEPINSDFKLIDRAVVRYHTFHQEEDETPNFKILLNHVSVQITDQGKELYRSAINNSATIELLQDNLDSMYTDMLRPISNNLKRGILMNDTRFFRHSLRIFIAPNIVIVDPCFPVGKLMVGVGERLVYVDDKERQSDIEILKLSRGYRSFVNHVKDYYSTLIFGIKEKIKAL